MNSVLKGLRGLRKDERDKGRAALLSQTQSRNRNFSLGQYHLHSYTWEGYSSAHCPNTQDDKPRDPSVGVLTVSLCGVITHVHAGQFNQV